MLSALIAVGWGVVALVGIGVFRGAAFLANADEQWDAIGSSRGPSGVEAADWKVWGYKLVGGALGILGTVLALWTAPTVL
jgi:hypothetical protein